MICYPQQSGCSRHIDGIGGFKSPDPLEKVGWGMIFSNPIPVPPAAVVSDPYPAFECHI